MTEFILTFSQNKKPADAVTPAGHPPKEIIVDNLNIAQSTVGVKLEFTVPPVILVRGIISPKETVIERIYSGGVRDIEPSTVAAIQALEAQLATDGWRVTPSLWHGGFTARRVSATEAYRPNPQLNGPTPVNCRGQVVKAPPFRLQAVEPLPVSRDSSGAYVTYHGAGYRRVEC